LGWLGRSGKVSGVYSVWNVSMDRRYIVSETSKHSIKVIRGKKRYKNYPSQESKQSTKARKFALQC
jgi:hypothetical protein